MAINSTTDALISDYIQMEASENQDFSDLDSLDFRTQRVKRKASTSAKENDLEPLSKRALKDTSEALLITHVNLMSIYNDLGYPPILDGFCNGIMSMASMAAMAEDIESFNTRIKKLDTLFKSHQGNVFAVANEIRTNSDFLAFFDGVSLWQAPTNYKFLFENGVAPAFQEDPNFIKTLLSMTQPLALENDTYEDKIGIEHVCSYPGAYNFNKLIKYLKLLKSRIEHSSITSSVVIKLKTMHHALGIVYDPKKKHWLFIDVNQLPVKKINTEVDLAHCIWKGFSNIDQFFLSTTVYTLKKDASILKPYFESEELKKFHQITSFMAHLKNSLNTSLLHLATQYNYFDTVKDLISIGANVNRIDYQNNTALMIASTLGHTEIVEALLAAHANTDISHSEGLNPLLIASKKGHITITKALLTADADPDMCHPDGFTPLLLASDKGHEEIVEALLAAHASVDLPDRKGFTPLLLASKRGYVNIVKALIAAHADPDMCHPDGFTPLLLASDKGHTEIVEALLAAHASVDLPDRKGFTPLLLASKRGYVNIVKALIAAHADPNMCHPDGFTPLLLASDKGHTETVEALVKGGARAGLTDSLYATDCSA